MRSLVVVALLAIGLSLSGFAFWAATAEPHQEAFVVPPFANDPYYLVGFTLRFPSPLYSKLVRLQAASYTDEKGRFLQEDAWVYEQPTYMCTAADEGTLSGLHNVSSYAPKGGSVTFLFKLRNAAHVSTASKPLELDSGPYTVTLRYKVLWFSRTVSFSYSPGY